MYYTARVSNEGRIERRDLDGSNPVVVVSSETSGTLSHPVGLALDLDGSILMLLFIANHVLACTGIS